ncbi:MAG: ABC transporter permease [Acidimicrobiia bacterium]|nr:ABC transporter permease [Acidimicrobiia bacterium]
MSRARMAAWIVLALILGPALAAGWIAPAPYHRQFREAIAAPPSADHPLGTDELGRDRLSRLLHATRVSLLLAPAAALLSTLLAAFAGASAAWLGRFPAGAHQVSSDLLLCLPWMFLLLTVRAALPLDVEPLASLVITFLLLGALGWAGPSRVVRAAAASLRNSDFLLLARAQGVAGWRLLSRHLMPALRPVLAAQFWTSIPLFILAEANLGILGLGVVEPLPSWGGLLKELENYSAIAENPFVLAPAALLLACVWAMHVLLARKERAA